MGTEEYRKPCKSILKETMVPLPFPFDSLRIVITSMKQENESQAKVELQDQDGKYIKTLIIATARISHGKL